MASLAALNGLVDPTSRLDPAAWIDASAVWAITLWTADRAPLLVGLTGQGLGLSRLGRLARQHWEGLDDRFPCIAHRDFAILPDRMRALVHIPWNHRVRAVGRIVRWFKASVERAARKQDLIEAAPIWDAKFEVQLVSSAEELWLWRRRINAGVVGGLAPIHRVG